MDSLESKRAPVGIAELPELNRGQSIDESAIIEICDFVDTREDCSDFRLTSLIRILFQSGHYLAESTEARIKQTLLNFRYWLDEPGDDSMCMWSENHQILFASCEYLAGQRYPDETFSNNGMTGQQRMSRARQRIMEWLHDRWEFGFIEWHSNVYYQEDIPPLSNLIDFAADSEVREAASVVMDLFLLDIALHSWKGLFSVSSGRCYERQKFHPQHSDLMQISEKLWGFGYLKQYDYATLSGVFLEMQNYRLPEAIRQIGLDQTPVVIKSSNGVNLDEMRALGFDMKSRKTGAFLWAMEAFTNHQAVNLSVDNFRDWNMRHNRFVSDMKLLANPLLRRSGLLPLITRLLNPVFNGVAIQRANTYTYKTPHYMLSTAQKYHPGDYGDQQHIWGAVVSPEITVFTTHPAVNSFSDDELLSLSPNNWVGNGRNPHSVQHENIHLSLYVVPRWRGFMEKGLHHYTHAFFPAAKFDQVIHEGHLIAGRAGDSYCGLIGGSRLEFADDNPDELIQHGRETWWICLMGSADEDGHFAAFFHRLRQAETHYHKRGHRRVLTVKTGGKTLQLHYKGDFLLDGQRVNTDYQRLESPYGDIPRRPEAISLQVGEHSYKRDIRQLRGAGQSAQPEQQEPLKQQQKEQAEDAA